MPKNITRLALLTVLFMLISAGSHPALADQAPFDNVIYLPFALNPGYLYLPFVTNPAPPLPAEPPAWLGLQGGAVMTEVIDPQNADVMYLGTWGSGIYKSSDGGQSWFPSRAGLGNQLIWSLAVDPKNSSVVYAGTHKNGLYKSVDGGSTWFRSSTGIQDDAVVYTIAIDPLNSSRIFIGTRGIAAHCSDGSSCPPWAGIVYKSNDAGATWSPALTNIGGSKNQFWAYTIVFDLLDPKRVFAAIDGAPGLYRSLNGGSSWSAAMEGITNPKGRAIVFDPTSTSPVVAFYGGWQAYQYTNVFKTADGGDTWTPKNNGISGIDIWEMAMTSSNPPVLFACTYHNGLLKSTTGGKTWTNAGVPASKVNSVTVSPEESNIVFAGSDEIGLFKSMNGGTTWALSQDGLITTWSTALLVSREDMNRLFMSTYGQGVFQSSDRGSTWTNMSKGLGDLYIHSLVMDPAHPNLIYALTDTTGLYRYDMDAGGSWARVSGGLPALAAGETAPGSGSSSYPPDYPFALPEKPDSDVYPELYASAIPAAPAAKPPYLVMSFAPSDPALAYLGTSGSGVYKSEDGGGGWSAAGLSGYVVWSLAVDPGDPNLVYAATSKPGIVKVSSTGGGSWSDSDLPGSNLIVYSLAFSNDNQRVLYAGTSDGVYQLSGGSWTTLGLPGYTVTAIAAVPNLPGYLYVGTTDGAFYSLDGGVTWQAGPSQLANLTTQEITFDPFYPYTAYFSTTGNGVMRVPFDQFIFSVK
jgi:photosystem II stability/assembly factor-like uncharacterized protein